MTDSVMPVWILIPASAAEVASADLVASKIFSICSAVHSEAVSADLAAGAAAAETALRKGSDLQKSITIDFERSGIRHQETDTHKQVCKVQDMRRNRCSAGDFQEAVSEVQRHRRGEDISEDPAGNFPERVGMS